VWSDDSVAARRVRFSPSGKYLAAAGRGVQKGASDVAIFEVDGFKRLPGFDWTEEEQLKEKIIHDLMFRPDEKNLLVAWHRDWIFDQMSQTKRGELWEKDMEEQAKIPGEARVRKLELYCTELDTENKEMTTSKINSLSDVYDLLEHGAIYFAPDASFLIYPKWYNRNNYVARHRVYRVDTRTWAEDEILLDRKYSMFGGTGLTTWYEWEFNQNGELAYLLVKEVDEGGWNDRAFALLKMDMTTKQTKELQRVSRTRSSERWPWSRVSLSLDEKRVALLGFGEALYDYGGAKAKIVTLRIWDMKPDKMKRYVYKHNAQRGGGRGLVWISDNALAISLSDNDGFFFVNIGEE
jgi:hypothetical protein